MNHTFFISLFAAVMATTSATAQAPVAKDTVSPQGGWVRREIVDGDTLYLASLNTVKIRSGRQFKSREERDKLARYRRYANNVRPYADQAVSMYYEMMEEKESKSKRQYRRYARQQKKIMKDDFEKKLKNLYETEGKILIKMIERQTGQKFYDIIKDTKGSVSATYWQNMSKLWGLNLKDGYIIGQDPIMDEVLLDFDYGEAIYKY